MIKAIKPIFAGFLLFLFVSCVGHDAVLQTLEKITIPVLAFFGEKDTQVDPIQGFSAYKNALTKTGNKNFRVELIPNADHNIILSKTGSLKERRSRSSKEWLNYAPEYLKIMEEWLKQLDK